MDISGLTRDDIICAVSPCYHLTLSQANKISNHIYKKKIKDFSLIPDIPKRLREMLNGIFSISLLSPADRITSSDGAVKYLFINESGLKFETVFIPDGKRNTVCVSTQSGCRMGCPFCATATYGFHGDLSSGDIINQVLGIPESEKVNHVVFMGMGEPMDNFNNVLKACRIFTAEWGLALSPANITVSTVGITPAIRDFLEESSCNLTLSLFSPFSAERRKLIPVDKIYPAEEIIGMLKTVPVKKKRRISVAYIMIDGLNDTVRHLEELKKILFNAGIRINLLAYHPSGKDEFLPSTDEKMNYFKNELNAAGISSTIRRSRGKDIYAACGLLASGLSK